MFYPSIILCFFPFVKSFFEFFSTFFKKTFRIRCTTKMSIGKTNKNHNFNRRKILRYMLFHENFCRFSSLLDIYKFVFLRYNNSRRGAIVLRVPSFAHRGSVSVKCQSHDIPLSRNGQRCAFLIFQKFRLPKTGGFFVDFSACVFKKGKKWAKYGIHAPLDP